MKELELVSVTKEVYSRVTKMTYTISFHTHMRAKGDQWLLWLIYDCL